MPIPLVDLKAQYSSIKAEIDDAIRRTLEGGQFILGAEVEAFENESAAYLNSKYAVGVASGTEALLLALLACGIGPGDEVITTPFTFIATAEAITQCGAVPVFVDIEPGTYNMDPAAIESKITAKSKCILPVHLYGHAVDMQPVLALARKHRLSVIEDCAQSLGTQYQGAKAGSLGDACCLSFFPSKVLGAYGDGGMIVTGSAQIAEKARMLRNHGCREKYFHLMPGFNSRLDSLHAAILRVKLRYLDRWIAQRQANAALYAELFRELEGIQPPYIAPYCTHNFNYYTIRLNTAVWDRARLQKHLSSRGVATAIYYPLSLHLQEVYRHLGHKPGDFPQSERAQAEVLSLPIYAELSAESIGYIVGQFKSYLDGKAGGLPGTAGPPSA